MKSAEVTLDELDRLAAVEVMSFTIVQSVYDALLWDDGRGERSKYAVSDWQPTRDIGQAWEGLNKLGRQVRISNKANSGYWWCYIDDVVAHGSTAAEAIVRACIKAKGVHLK